MFTYLKKKVFGIFTKKNLKEKLQKLKKRGPYMLIIYISGYFYIYNYHLEKVPYFERNRMMFPDDRLVNYIQNIVEKELEHIETLPDTDESVQLFKKIGQQILDSSGEKDQNGWSFNVVDSNSFAFSLHKNVFVSKEFLNTLKNESEIAWVVSHEISHVLLRHLYEHYSALKELNDSIVFL